VLDLRHAMRPFALEIVARDFAFAAGHRRVAISRLVSTLRSKPTPAAAAVFLGLLGRRLLAERGRDARRRGEIKPRRFRSSLEERTGGTRGA
jgi:hypothetical protein